MTRRFLVITVVAVMLLLLPTPLAHADVVWSNEFLEETRDEVMELERNVFIVNSETGYLASVEYPVFSESILSSENNRRVRNGQTVFLTHVYYYNGEFWGIGDFQGHGGPTGWFLMNRLLVRYDRRDFHEAHENEFYDFTGEFDMELLVDRLVTWQWPGSDFPKIIHELAEDYYEFNQDEFYIGFDPLEDVVIKNINIHFAYRDSEGRQWGFVEIKAEGNYHSIGHGGFTRSTRTWDAWICLDDPSNETNIPSFYPAPPPQEWSPDESWVFDESRRSAVFGSNDEHSFWRVGVVILFISSFGIVMFFIIRRRKKRKD